MIATSLIRAAASGWKHLRAIKCPSNSSTFGLRTLVYFNIYTERQQPEENYCSLIYPSYFSKRFRYKKNKESIKEDDDDPEEEEEEFLNDKVSKIINTHVTSLRLDAVIKAGIGIARNKVDVIFYENRIRLNGKKVPKKSTTVGTDDEIDIIKGQSANNDELLSISRLIILATKPSESGDSVNVKIRRYKTLTIDNYSEAPWKNVNTDN